MADLLGHGGAGQVWRADDLELGRPVAVKLLQQSGSTDDAIRSEARKAARLVHPNVVAVYDVVAADDGRAFLVMELVDGPNLAEVLRAQGQLPSADVGDIAVQTARALDAAHAAGVVHCDVKPGNLLLAPDGTVKMTDFGIASIGSAHNLVLLGTASYVSPEQVRGQSATPASDWYALGCVLYELLAGSPPFVADNTEVVLRQHVHAAPVPIQSIRPDVNRDLGAVVMGLLAKDPTQRPSSAQMVSTAVSGSRALDTSSQTQVLPILDSAVPLAAYDDQAPGDWPDTPTTRRRRVLLPLAAIATVALIVAAAIAVFRDSTTPADTSQQQPGPTKVAKTTPRPSSPTPPPTTRSTPRPTTPTPTVRRLDAGAALTTLAQLLRQQPRGREAKFGRGAARDIDQAAALLAAGETDKAAEKYRDTRQRLTEAQQDGRWTPTPQISALLTQLDRTLL